MFISCLGVLCLQACALHVCLVLSEAKRGQGSPGLESQMLVRDHMDGVKQTQGLQKNSYLTTEPSLWQQQRPERYWFAPVLLAHREWLTGASATRQAARSHHY